MKMNNKSLLLPITLILIFILGMVLQRSAVSEQKVTDYPVDMRNDSTTKLGQATERYTARVDRVAVVFEQWDYTKYQLQTNELIREGAMNTERGFENDVDATVYILNWQKPAGEQIIYVRLTSKPTWLYLLDSDKKIIRGSRLQLQ